jgi:hypothetical protein
MTVGPHTACMFIASLFTKTLMQRSLLGADANDPVVPDDVTRRSTRSARAARARELSEGLSQVPAPRAIAPPAKLRERAAADGYDHDRRAA